MPKFSGYVYHKRIHIGWGYSRPLRRPGVVVGGVGGGWNKSLWVLYSSNPCVDFHYIFRICVSQEDLELIRFWRESGNICCHGNTLKIFQC